MSNVREESRRFRLAFVVGGAVFVILIVVLAMIVGDGPWVPAIFVIGWLVLALFLVRHLVTYFRGR